MEPPRKKLHRREAYLQSRFLTFSCFGRLPLLKNPKIADEMAACLERARLRRGFRLIAWVIMPEHVHLLMVPKPVESDGRVRVSVPSLLMAIKRPLAATVLERWRQANWQGLSRLRDAEGEARFWQPGGGFDRNVRDAEEYAKTIEYIHQNPVERGLVAATTDYRWSSARAYAGIDDGLVHVDQVKHGEPWDWRND
ncbi:MAG: transposase [Phycisphaerales bacterium]